MMILIRGGSRPKYSTSIEYFSDSILWKVPEYNGTRKLYKNRRVATTFTILVYFIREGTFRNMFYTVKT